MAKSIAEEFNSPAYLTYDCLEDRKMIFDESWLPAEYSINPSLRYFCEKYKLPAIQVVKELEREKIEDGIEIVQGLNFLKSLYL